MYFQRIEIENTGPIEYLNLELPFSNGKPKPVIIVGENGTGKSILLSHLVNALIVGKGYHYEDTEVELGKVYKYRSANYIKSGKGHSSSLVRFTTGIEVRELQLSVLRNKFGEEFNYSPVNPMFRMIPDAEASTFQATFDHHHVATEDFFRNSCCLYFPVNRFEEPAWLNRDNLMEHASYTDLKHIAKYSNRSIINISPLKKNQNWLLDVLLDRSVFEIRFNQIPPVFTGGKPVQAFGGFAGQATSIYEAIIGILKVILRSDGNIRLGVGTRKRRNVSVMKDEKVWVPNLFQLSSGELQLVNLFLSIIRDYDLSDGKIENLTDIKGVVIIDEIDANLHTVHQKEILPTLIASFPNVQFIISTHSPLFLLGMEARLGNDNFEVINMPDGERFSANDFSEFKAAYDAFAETRRHREEINRALEVRSQPIVYVEGDYDIRYLQRAATLLNKNEILNGVQLKDGDGFGNLDKIWRAYDNPIAGALPCKLLLLYDCDIKKPQSNRGKVYRKVMPTQIGNPIQAGIENLFSHDAIRKAESFNNRFIDFSQSSITRTRGQEVVNVETRSVNKDEKGNLCDWFCEHGTAEDFQSFAEVFNLIEEVLRQ